MVRQDSTDLYRGRNQYKPSIPSDCACSLDNTSNTQQERRREDPLQTSPKLGFRLYMPDHSQRHCYEENIGDDASYGRSGRYVDSSES
jgi:hypothetical protein